MTGPYFQQPRNKINQKAQGKKKLAGGPYVPPPRHLVVNECKISRTHHGLVVRVHTENLHRSTSFSLRQKRFSTTERFFWLLSPLTLLLTTHPNQKIKTLDGSLLKSAHKAFNPYIMLFQDRVEKRQ